MTHMFWSPIICFDSTIIGDQNKLSVIKTFDICVISKADVWAINALAYYLLELTSQRLPLSWNSSQLSNWADNCHNAFLTFSCHNMHFQFLGIWFSWRWTTSLPGIMAVTIKIVSWRTPLKMAALAKAFDRIKAAKGTPITSRFILK